MTPRRKASRTDPNHAEIRDGLRALGFLAFDTHNLGEGFPDLVVVSRSGRAALVYELKAPWDHPEWRLPELTKDEVRFMVKIVPEVYRIVTTLEQAAEIIMDMD